MDGGQINGYRNSGMARFGANTGPYTPPAYTPQQFTPRTFSSGPQMQMPTQAGAPQGNRFGVQPVQSGSSNSGSSASNPYSFPTGGSSSLGNGQTIHYGDGTNQGISPGLARGLGLLGGWATGSPIIGGLLGQIFTGAGASTAGNMNGRAPFSDARTGNYSGNSGTGAPVVAGMNYLSGPGGWGYYSTSSGGSLTPTTYGTSEGE